MNRHIVSVRWDDMRRSFGVYIENVEIHRCGKDHEVAQSFADAYQASPELCYDALTLEAHRCLNEADSLRRDHATGWQEQAANNLRKAEQHLQAARTVVLLSRPAKMDVEVI